MWNLQFSTPYSTTIFSRLDFSFSRINSEVLLLISKLNLSYAVLLLSIQGSFVPYPTTRQSSIKSMSSENLFINPYAFERLVPPLNDRNFEYSL